MEYTYTLLGTLIALAVYIGAVMMVGSARAKTGVKAPATTGHPDFERAFRAHQNTLEQIVMFLPLVWITALLWNDMWGGIFAAIWIIGRVLYIVGYTAAAEKRAAGFMISAFASITALIACLYAVVMRLI